MAEPGDLHQPHRATVAQAGHRTTATFNTTVRFDNFGTIDVAGGAWSISAPGFLGTATYQVADGASLTSQSVDGVTQWQGAHDATGGGTVDRHR